MTLFEGITVIFYLIVFIGLRSYERALDRIADAIEKIAEDNKCYSALNGIAYAIEKKIAKG